MNLRSKGGSHREKSTFSVPKQSPSFSPCAHFKSLSQAKITEIYGIRVSVQRGNDLLRVLQDQRLSGTLDYGVKAPGLDPEKALSWLRTNHPIDEDAAISARLDREEIQAEQTDRLGVEESGTYKPQQGAEKASVYGDSVIDRVKKYNEKRVVEKHQKEEESRKSDKGSQVPEDSGQRAVVARRTESAEWVKRYKAKATSDLKEAPRMTKFQRLWGSTVVTFAVVGLSILFAQHYMLPARRARIWPDIPPAAATIIALIGINVAVFLVWRLPQTWRFMNRYFMLVPGYPHSFSIIGNTFSHQGLSHLAMNMAVLWFVGTRLHDEIGRGNFLAVYLSCAALSSYITLVGYVFRGVFYTSSLGASGVVCGLIASWCCIASDKHISFIFLPLELTRGLSSYVILFALIAVDVVGLSRALRRPGRVLQVNIDHMAHLGGYATGIVSTQALRYQARQRQQEKQEGKKKTGQVILRR